MVGDFIICLLAFSNIYIYLFIQKKGGLERGLEGGPKRGPKGGSRREGPRFVYTQASLPVFAFSKMNSSKQEIAQSFLSTAKFITKYSSERFLSICGEKIYLKAF